MNPLASGEYSVNLRRGKETLYSTPPRYQNEQLEELNLWI